MFGKLLDKLLEIGVMLVYTKYGIVSYDAYLLFSLFN